VFNKLRWWILTFFTTSNSDIFSELHRNYLFKCKFCLQFDQTGPRWCRCANGLGLQTCSVQLPQLIINMVNSYSFNLLWTMITAMIQEKSNTFCISEPIIRRCFPQDLCHFVHFWAVSLIHSALEINAATLRKVLAPFSFSHVTDSCSLLFLFSFFFLSFFLSRFYNNWSGWAFNKINNFTTEKKFFYAVWVYNESITSIHDELWYGLSSPTALDQSENEKLIRCGKKII